MQPGINVARKKKNIVAIRTLQPPNQRNCQYSSTRPIHSDIRGLDRRGPDVNACRKINSIES